MSTGRRLLLASITRTVLSLTQMAIGFFMMPFLVAKLGNQWYGIWTIISSVIAYFYLMDVGLGQAVQITVARHIATKEYARANAVLNTSVAIYCAISVGILLITCVLATSVRSFVGESTDEGLVAMVLVLLGVNIAAEFPMNAFSGVISAHARFDLINYSRFIMVIVSALLTLYFVSHGYGVVALAVIALICGMATNVAFFLIAKHCFPQMRLGWRWFERGQVKELAHISAWSFLSTLSNLIKYRLQPIIIAFFSGAAMVTHYVIGSRLADYFRDIVFQATNLSMPILTKYYALRQMDELHAKLQFFTRINSALAVFGAGITIIVGRQFIARWMGPEYVDAYPALVILVIAMMVEVIIDPARVAMSAMGKIRFVGLLEFSEALLNVALTVILVKTYGMLGAALGTAIPLLVLKLLVAPRVLCRHIQMDLGLLYKAVIPSMLLIGGYLAVYGWFVEEYFQPLSYFAIGLTVLCAVPIYIGIVIFLFTREELAMVMKLLPFFKPQPAGAAQ